MQIEEEEMTAFLEGLTESDWLNLALDRSDDLAERAGTLAWLYAAECSEDRASLLQRTLARDAPADRVRRWLQAVPLDWDAVEERALQRLPLPRSPLGARTQRDQLESIHWSLR
jgi:hypothetical protein